LPHLFQAGATVFKGGTLRFSECSAPPLKVVLVLLCRAESDALRLSDALLLNGSPLYIYQNQKIKSYLSG